MAADNNLGDVTSDLTFDGGTLQLTSSFATARTIMLSAGGDTLDTQNNAIDLSGDISGTGGFTKTGAATLTLSSRNINYAGASARECWR